MIWYTLLLFLCFFYVLLRHNATGHPNHLKLSTLYRLIEDNDIVKTDMVAENSTGQMDIFRLPNNVIPVSYTLKIATDFEKLMFSGYVEIVIEAVSRTCQITLNAKELNVTEVEVIDYKSNETFIVVNQYIVDRNEQLIISLNDTNKCLMPSKLYIIKITYDACLRDDMSGYYRSSYRENNEIKWLAVTHFEPTYARLAFPCFDEPVFKVPFKISVRRRYDQISLSNMPLVSSTKIQYTNMFWDNFEETPPIPTYLVAFFVGEFYEMKTQTIGVFTHASYINQAQYIVNKSPNLIKAMENFTGVEYMLPKLDLIAIPDFAIGAMENWGMITYRERLLLLPENSKTKTKEFITTVVQHEISHQWFGDLVTCAWWDYLWLNEGFATYFEYFATQMVEPDWRLENVFVYEVHQTALKHDQRPTHAISGSVLTPSQINDMFDDISYSKAGAVLRMLQYTVTEDNFKMALNFYLEENAYKAATPEELWVAFENILYENDFDLEDNITITKFMRSWTEQSGYPLVKIVKVNNTFVITQERFLVDSKELNATNKWIIGLTYTTESKQDFNRVLPMTWMVENKMVLSNQTDSGWYIFNLQSIGFYRVQYDEENWNALINQFMKDCNVIHVINRAQIIDDAFNLALADQLDYTLVLRLSQYLEKEDDIMPWYTAKYEFELLISRMRRCSHAYKYIKLYVKHLAEIIFDKIENLVVNRKNTDHSTMTSWNSYSNWACKLDSEHCTNTALSYFNMWREGKKIPADIIDAALCTGVKQGGEDVWNSVLKVYTDSESPSERQSAQLALACSTNPVQLSRYLDFMFKGHSGPIRPQDFRVIYQSLSLTPQGITVLIEFLTNKLDRIVNDIINGEKVAAAIYSILASNVVKDDEIFKIDQLRNSSLVPDRLQKRFNSSFSVVEEYLIWFNKHHTKISQWTKNYVDVHGLDVPHTTQFSSTPTIIPPVKSSNDTSRSWGTSLNTQSIACVTQIICLVLLLSVLM